MEEGLMPTPVTVIRPGDFLKCDKGLQDRVGVAWFDGRVLHNSFFRGEHLPSIEEFAPGRPYVCGRHRRRNGAACSPLA